MSWKKMKLGTFLKHRDDRYKPDDIEISGLKRVDKIDFSGGIFLSEKGTKTDMILVKSGDLLISGINVEKGAMCVYQGEEDVVATIHYSSYEFDAEQIDVEFLKYYLKSAEFKLALKEQVPGGIKTEIKPKHLLPLVVDMPTDVDEQREIVDLLKKQEGKNKLLAEELNHQLAILKKLRQSLLQDAVQGKLVTQDASDESATVLLQKIKAEKEALIAAKKLKKDKPLPPIKEEEIPFVIPEGWVWCRLGEICKELLGGFAFLSTQYVSNSNNQVIRLGNVKPDSLELETSPVFIDDSYATDARKAELRVGDILITMTGTRAKRDYLFSTLLTTVEFNGRRLFLNQRVGCFRFSSLLDLKYLNIILKDRRLLNPVFDSATGAANQANIGVTALNEILVPLPSCSEQQRIVQKLESLVAACDALEASIKESQQQAQQLLQTALREALLAPSYSLNSINA